LYKFEDQHSQMKNLWPTCISLDKLATSLPIAVSRTEFPRARLMPWMLPLLLGFGCSISSAQIEPNAGKWKTWVLTSGDQMRLPPPPDEAETRAEITQLKALAKQRDAATLDRIIWWNAGPPGYRWTSIAIPPGPANASLHSRIMALLSVAIYDATIAAWDSKYAYNRPRPSVFDPSLKVALPNPQSPGLSRAMQLRFTGNQAAQTGTTSSTRRSTSIGSM
jgi:hypothetical protein